MTMEKKESGGFALPNVDNIDIGRLGSVYGKPRGKADNNNSEPEYLEINKKGRDIWTRVNFNTGVSWFSGFLIAGLYGFQEGWRGASSSNMKIRFNSVLNGVSKRGNKAANIGGTIAFMHTVFSYVASDVLELDRQVNHEVANPAFAGAITGLLFTSTRSSNVMAYATAIGSVSSVAYFYAHVYYDKWLFERRFRRF
jgi:hypothetical protein